MRKEVVVVGGVRTAIGKFGGSMKDMPPTELGALTVHELLVRTNVEARDVSHVVFGNVIVTEPRDFYLSRVAAINAGIPESTASFNDR